MKLKSALAPFICRSVSKGVTATKCHFNVTDFSYENDNITVIIMQNIKTTAGNTSSLYRGRSAAVVFIIDGKIY